MKVYQLSDFAAIDNEQALSQPNCVTKAVLKLGFKTIDIAKDEKGNIRQVKLLVRDNNVIKGVFLANIDQSARTLSQEKTKEIMTWFETHTSERETTIEDDTSFKVNGQPKKVTYIVTYHGNGYRDHRNYTCKVISSEIVNAYDFID